MNKVKILGQVFTPYDTAKYMTTLIKNNGLCLEPSSGDGIFLQFLKNYISIEYDKVYADKTNSLNIDFFEYDISEKFDTVIGNPPYVLYKNFLENTKKLLNSSIIDDRGNLFLHFIEKSFYHLNDNGEIIFIIPKEFLKLTSAIKLIAELMNNGTFTHILDLSEDNTFKGYGVDAIIFRYEKNNYNRDVITFNGVFKLEIVNGFLNIKKDNEKYINFSDLFYVKVGAVSGMDKIFNHDDGIDFVFSETCSTNKTKKMLYNTIHDSLLTNKELLLNRKIKKFNDNNWFCWGRNMYNSLDDRIYVNTKTRKHNPFFINDCKNYDGSILAIFPKSKKYEIEFLKNFLNSVDWQSIGFYYNGRYIFNQKALENCILPEKLLYENQKR